MLGKAGSGKTYSFYWLDGHLGKTLWVVVVEWRGIRGICCRRMMGELRRWWSSLPRPKLTRPEIVLDAPSIEADDDLRFPTTVRTTLQSPSKLSILYAPENPIQKTTAPHHTYVFPIHPFALPFLGPRLPPRLRPLFRHLLRRRRR